MKYFRSTSDLAYEAARLGMDAVLQLPQGETSIEPAATAPRDTEGNILLAIREMHADAEPYASAITQALSQGAATEITGEDYQNALLEANVT